MSITLRQLQEAQTGRVIVARLEMATSIWKQTLGLMGRACLSQDAALWLEPCNAVHTFGMRFPIDVLFLDRQGRALRLVSNLRPWRICGPVWGARTVVELPVGMLTAEDIRVGDRLIAAAGTEANTEQSQK